MIELRHLTENDTEALLKLRAAAFSRPADKGVPAWVVRESYGVFDNSTLLASFFLRHLTLNYCGSLLPMYGVGGVSTMPLSRHSGYIRRLFELAAEEARRNEVALGMLYPFSYVYYRQFGYERLSPRITVSLPFTELEDFPRNQDGELYNGSQRNTLLSVYNRYALTVNLMTLREDDEAFCATPENNLQYTYLHHSATGCDGYVTLQYTPDAIDVRETVFTSPEALQGLIGMLRMFQGQRRTLTFSNLPDSSPVLNLLNHYKACTYTLSNGPMARIFDTARLLRANLYPDVSGHFTLTVHDPLPSCGGTFAVEYYKGAAEVRSANGEADMELDSAALSRLVLSGTGYSAQELPFLPGVKVRSTVRSADFARAFPRRMTDHMAHY